MTAIQLLEKLGADVTFDINQLNDEDKKILEHTILKAKTFNASEVVHAPDEEDDSGKEEKEEKEEEKP